MKYEQITYRFIKWENNNLFKNFQRSSHYSNYSNFSVAARMRLREYNVVKQIESKKPFACHQCKKTYAWKISLTRHLREECGKPPQNRCNRCGKCFKQLNNLKRHKTTVHRCFLYWNSKRFNFFSLFLSFFKNFFGSWIR